jgi:uncharacterized protein
MRSTVWIFVFAATWLHAQETVAPKQAKAPTANAPVAASISASKRLKIDELMELSGGKKVMSDFMKELSDPARRSSAPMLPNEFWDRLLKEAKPEQMIEMLVPIYDKYYTEPDLDELLVFYKTPLGKKLLDVGPKVMMESVLAGQEWGQKLGRQIMEDMIKEGKVPLQPAQQ